MDFDIPELDMDLCEFGLDLDGLPEIDYSEIDRQIGELMEEVKEND